MLYRRRFPYILWYGIENTQRYIYLVSEGTGNTNSSSGTVCLHRGCVMFAGNAKAVTGSYLLVISYFRCIGSKPEKNTIWKLLFLRMRHCSLSTKQRAKVSYVVTTVPLQVQEDSLHKLKVGVWCATSARKIIRTVLFKEMNSSPYVKLILYEFQASDTA